nr:hypothetical protein [uncultured Desulfobulbus sp.]
MRETYFPRDLDPDLLQRQKQRYIDLLLPLLREAQLAGELRSDLELPFVLGHLYGLYTVVLSAWFRDRLTTEKECITLLTILFEQALQGLMPQPQNAHE